MPGITCKTKFGYGDKVYFVYKQSVNRKGIYTNRYVVSNKSTVIKADIAVLGPNYYKITYYFGASQCATAEEDMVFESKLDAINCANRLNEEMENI